MSLAASAECFCTRGWAGELNDLDFINDKLPLFLEKCVEDM
jgi:hypothetical protein